MRRIWKKIIGTIMDREKDFEQRMFYLVMFSGPVCAFFGMIVCLLAHVQTLGILVELTIFIGSSILLGIGIAFPKWINSCKLVLCVSISILIPLVWVTAGGIKSGVNIWFAYGLIFISFLYGGRQMICFSAYYVGCIAAALIFAAKFPQYIWTFETERDMYVSIVGSCIAVTTGVVAPLLFYREIYMGEQAISKSQQKELERINETQKSFFANISHEIRTPINTIIGLNEMNLRGSLSEDAQENCENIQSASQMLLSLINDVLDISKIQSGKMDIVPEKYEISNMLSDLVNMIWVRAYDKGLEFRLDVDEDIPCILYGDAVRIKQVLINILTNAVKYTEKGSVSLTIKGERISSRTYQLVMAVSDTGIGIKKEDIRYLFDSFKRVDERNTKNIEGTGLGLAISHQLIQLMGGEIKVDSIYQQGTTFTIVLEQEIVDPSPTGAIGENLKHRNKRRKKYMQSFEAPEAKILVVDDNQMNQMVATKLLSATKLQVDVASSGKQCLEMTLKKRYDVILMDHLMPEMDGLETLEALRVQTMGLCRDVPVIALTANAGVGMEDFYKQHGFQGYVVKPISGILLEEMLLRFLPQELVERTSVLEEDAEDDEDVAIDIERVYRKKIMVTADSVCDLPKELLEQYHIKTMPYYVVAQEKRLREGEEIWTDNIFEFMDKMNGKIKSGPPDIEEYEKFFGRYLGEAEQIIHVCMTSKSSLGYERALKAAESFDNVYVIDSEHLSTGMGLFALELAKMVQKHYMLDEILRRIPEIKRSVRTSFILADTAYLYYSGRIPYIVDRICSIFSIYPVLQLKNGHMRLQTIYGGSLEHAQKKYIRSRLMKREGIKTDLVLLTHAGCNLEERRMHRKEMEKYIKGATILDQTASSAISSNCGPRTLGVMFVKEELKAEELGWQNSINRSF